MGDSSTGFLISFLLLLIVLSGFFSGSETGMMSINRYKLKHLAKSGHRAAQRVARLLERIDRLIGLILIGNNFVNNLAATVATVVAVRYWGDYGFAIAPLVLTIVMLIFSELTPKTLAAMNPEKIAFPAALILEPLLKLLSPIVWIINVVANNLLRLLGVKSAPDDTDHLNAEELRTVVNEASALIPSRHRKMLLSILDLENVTVDDIMVPRNEIVGIDLSDEWSNVLSVLSSCQHTRLLAYNEELDNIMGFVHARDILHLITSGSLDPDTFKESLQEVYYVPEGTPLNTQLLKFQRKKERIGLVVNEYGDIQGLVTLEDILEEIVGEFTTDVAQSSKDIHPQKDESFIVDGSANIRELNRTMHWQLPTDGPKTLSGLIVETLESIPTPGTSIKIAEHPIEIVQIKDNMVKSAKVYPAINRLK